MILTEDEVYEDAPPLKAGQTSLATTATLAHTSQPPPPYEETPLVERSGSSALLPSSRGFSKRYSACWRLFKAYCIALLVLAVVGIVWNGLTIGQWNIGWRDPLSPVIPRPNTSLPHGTTPIDGNIVTCVQTSDWKTVETVGYSKPDPQRPSSRSIRIAPNDTVSFTSHASLSLPLNAAVLYFVNQGSRKAGAVTIESSGKIGTEIMVNIAVIYKTAHALKHIDVCKVERSSEEVGIALNVNNSYTFGQLQPTGDLPVVDMKILIPLSADGSPVVINNLQSTLQFYSHHVEDLRGLVHFRSIELHALSGPITVVALSADKANLSLSSGPISGSFYVPSIYIKTSNSPITISDLVSDEAVVMNVNGPIIGSFNITSLLTLDTSNAPIRAKITAFSDDNVTSEIQLNTSNDAIDADVNLYSFDSISGGTFNISATCMNGDHLNISIPVQPENADVLVTARGVFTPVFVSLNQAYEGKFQLASVLGSVRLDQHHFEDPTGRNRERHVEVHEENPIDVKGDVSWSSEATLRSFASLWTLRSHALLNL
ncbi:hypothetical protein BD410DRAFT_789033 [Rickenella mellea]|uniref:Uncharacterized protein n=1 Tax=Rickenella mellea TaxID=50990 RepID=A0A4Y7Q551_9AGAM|nr:hypothetical protein BD410DRAFT_789033 [Rickenella mellea]